jgi:vitamin B12 transporter
MPTDTYLRLSLARGIKEPTLLESFAREPFYVGNPNLKPAKTDSFEAGLFREWFGRRVRTEVAYFRNRFEDLIQFDFSSFPSTWQNIARSWARGVEVSGQVRLRSYVSVRANYTRLYTRIVTTNNASDLGLELLRRAPNSGSVSLELAPRRFTFVIGARFVGDRRDSDFFVFGVNRNPAYQYAYLSGSWRVNNYITPFFRVNNLSDETYQEALGYGQWSRNASGGVRITW